MYNTSTEYKDQIRNTLRNPSYMKVSFTVDDPQAGDDSIISNNGEIYYSNSDDIVNKFDVSERYATLELNRFVLTGHPKLPPELGDSYLYQGFIGNEISDIDGDYTIVPKITIDFSTLYFSFIGTTLSFDTILGDLPKTVSVIAYNDLVEVYNSGVIAPTTSEYFVIEEIIPECNKLEIHIYDSEVPYRRARLENVIFGIVKVFDDDSISSTSLNKKVDLINSKLPIVNFDFTVIDIDREYDPENPESIYKYIEEGQECVFEYGYELEDETIEWITGGRTFATGEIDIKTSSNIPVVTFKTSSILESLTEIYREGVYSVSGKTLYQLAEEVLNYADIPLDEYGNDRWILDTSLNSYTTKLPLPKVSLNVLLQLIANAGKCVLSIDRNGYIVIAPETVIEDDFTFTFEDIATLPDVKTYPKLQGVDTFVNSLSYDPTPSELATLSITGATSTVYEFEYQLSITQSAIATGGLSIVGSPSYFANMCRITLNGSGTLTIYGYKSTLIKQAINVEFNSVGERCPIENSLINTIAHATSYATWIGDYVSRKNEYIITDRGFPEIDCGDNISVNTLYTDDVRVNIIESKIDYNGSLSGKTKLLIK